MDELTEALGASFQVTKGQNNIYSPHPRQQSYKKKTAYGSDQNTRRRRYLEIQKQKRIDYKSHARRLALDKWSDDEEEEKLEDEVDETEMEVITHIKPPRRYKDQLMLSEWLVEVPPDFEDNWLMTICPIGKRNLVVAAKGRTFNYSKSGYRLNTFTSSLPGGSKSSSTGYTLLDCIYCETERKFYILDIMCWNQHPLYDCETEFRFFWLKSKMEELDYNEELMQSYQFEVLPKCPCKKENMEEELSKNLSARTDGVLFFHKESHYTFGSTPLVLWLKPDMLSDMLGLELPTIMESA